jgi:hypothetical protein
MHFNENQDGSALLSGIMAIGVLFIAFFAVNKSASNFFSVNRDSVSRQSEKEVSSVVREVLAAQIGQFAKDGCPSGALGSYFANESIGSFGTFRLTNSIPEDPSAPTYYRNAIARCASPIIPDANTTEFHFCLAVERNLGAAGNLKKSSFLFGIQPFIEIRGKMVDIRTNAGLRCYQYDYTLNAGTETVSTIYWSRSKTGQMERNFYKQFFHFISGKS